MSKRRTAAETQLHQAAPEPPWPTTFVVLHRLQRNGRLYQPGPEPVELTRGPQETEEAFQEALAELVAAGIVTPTGQGAEEALADAEAARAAAQASPGNPGRPPV